MLDFKRIAEHFMKNSVYVFTTDIDFAPEWAIEETIDVFKRLRVPLTTFITHPSEAINKEYGSKEKQRYVGLHPWFSSILQGKTFFEVMNTMSLLWPPAIGVRTHGFHYTSKIKKTFFKHGLKYDSSPCLFLQPYSTPLRDCSGLTLFPVWWEDDVHISKALPLEMKSIEKELVIPGLKIINMHPILFAMNSADKSTIFGIQVYQDKEAGKWCKTVMSTIDDDKWMDYVYKGIGVQTFITQLIEYLKQNNATIAYLDDVYKSLEQI